MQHMFSFVGAYIIYVCKIHFLLWVHVQMKFSNRKGNGEMEINFALSGRGGVRRVTDVVASLDEKMRTCCVHS